jgi:hypothetical protein
MIDMANTIAPKSDQLNADDFIGGPRTIVITKVTGNEGSTEQPVSIWFEGDNGKPWKPCKSSRRVLVIVWGADPTPYIGRSLTLFRDPTVTWGGMAVGGIRISHMSDIDEPVTMALTASKQVRKPFTVKPLAAAPKVVERSPIDEYAVDVGDFIHNKTPDELAAWWAETSELRLSLDIPKVRLAKMEAAVQKAINP